MSLRLKSFHTLMVVFAIALGTNALAQPVFENQTPVGFSPLTARPNPRLHPTRISRSWSI